MAVKAKRRIRGVGKLVYGLSASQLLQENHPLHASFLKFVGSKPATKRQASKFLAKYPQFREVKSCNV